MPKKRKYGAKPCIKYHTDGTVWAKGQTINELPTGYWEWYRKTGTKMRSGTFESGEQIGEWTTYDKDARVYKVTTIKPKTK
jgi:antitoxin component YwqK of YwqJK toxin-antitoxin module